MTAAMKDLLTNTETLATVLVALLFGWKAEKGETTDRALTALDYTTFIHGDYSNLTVAQLRQIASGYSIKGCWKMRKADLVRELDSIPAKPEELDFLNVITVNDKETEKFFTIKERKDSELVRWDGDVPVYTGGDVEKTQIPTWAMKDNHSSYFTNSGDNPVVKCLATKIDEDVVTGAKFYPEEIEDLPDDPSKPLIIESWKDPVERRISKLAEEKVWEQRKREKQQRQDRFYSWTCRVLENKDRVEKLKELKRSIWKFFYSDKNQGLCYLTKEQLDQLGLCFRQAGLQFSVNH